MLCLQSGNIWTPENMTVEIHKQFETAFKLGASEKIKNLVSSTGIHDSTSNLILNVLVELGKKLWKHAASTQAMPEAEAAAALKKEFSELLQGKKLDNIPILLFIIYTPGPSLCIGYTSSLSPLLYQGTIAAMGPHGLAHLKWYIVTLSCPSETGEFTE
jgi:hypothetical protein